MDLDAVAAELYGLEPGSFLSAREVRAKEAKDAGDRALATAINGLRRPSTSAWLANALVRQRSALVGELIGLGERMREAQAGLDAAGLRALSPRRHEVVHDLLDAARTIARRAGMTVSDAVTRELDATFEAALADPGAADALHRGCLVKPLSHSGFVGIDLSREVPRNTSTPKPTGRSRTDTRSTPRGGARARRGASGDELRVVKADVAETAAGARSAARRREAAEQELDRRRRARTTGEERLAVLQRAEAEARQALQTAKREETAADRALRAARERLDRAGTTSPQPRRRGE
ncbi:MAG TPA: hypothetical protein VK277_14590 [Acidimicrobiales bacterium]|nr:hypothetical protein [Acidimicrobiales bacterium]